MSKFGAVSDEFYTKVGGVKCELRTANSLLSYPFAFLPFLPVTNCTYPPTFLWE